VFWFDVDPEREPDTWPIVGPDLKDPRPRVHPQRDLMAVLEHLLEMP
jgi:hypothetical protein